MPWVQIALVATDTWVLVYAMLGYMHLGIDSHIGYYSQSANRIVGYGNLGANSICLYNSIAFVHLLKNTVSCNL